MLVKDFFVGLRSSFLSLGRPEVGRREWHGRGARGEKSGAGGRRRRTVRRDRNTPPAGGREGGRDHGVVRQRVRAPPSFLRFLHPRSRIKVCTQGTWTIFSLSFLDSARSQKKRLNLSRSLCSGGFDIRERCPVATSDAIEAAISKPAKFYVSRVGERVFKLKRSLSFIVSNGL